MEKPKGLWLNLGCSDNLIAGFVNIDKDFSGIDDRNFTEEQKNAECRRFDLTNMAEGFYKDSSVDYILAKDIIEHLPNKIETMNQFWRVLKPGGIVHIEVPTTEGRGAFQDPTHVSFWNRNSFFYFEDGNIYRERFAKAYGITARFQIVKEHTERFINDEVKLTISLKAIK